jgi:mRNA interferase RelE/StbE
MWKVEYRKRFLKELVKLPLHVQAKAEKLVFEELAGENPFELELLEHMKGYPGKYKIRIGQYRIGLSLNRLERLIVCERIAHRKDIYKLFP